MRIREDFVRIMDQRDHLVMENKRLQEQLEEERMKVSLLKKEIEESNSFSKKEITSIG
ncbi:hypothetical protein [Halobacillus sp. BBL2006]|uniref:hypothetical protein n=1 Tax=Halobacillus sp. BBL2006 TaxID=1543706 RepID=UPI0012E06C0E|nr:hypothetical protein [Halobacillus sp. BBL2006]